MKKRLAILLASAALILTAIAQTFTATSRFWRFQSDPVFDAAGNMTACVVQAFYRSYVSDGTTTYPGPDQLVQWDAVATGNQTIVVNGKTLTRYEVALAIVAISEEVRTAPPPPPPPPPPQNDTGTEG